MREFLKGWRRRFGGRPVDRTLRMAAPRPVKPKVEPNAG